MDTLFDYLKWIGPYSFKEVEFNIVDQLILSTLSYIRFEDFYSKEESLETIAPRVLEGGFSLEKYRVKEDEELLIALSKTKRYKNLILTNPESKSTTIESEEATQFGAMTLYDDEFLYILFRGTDSTLVGWKEDFEMSFSEAVPADMDGARYLDRIANIYSNKKIVITGHSKGGHIATYSYVTAKEEIKERVIACYNNDGPGFNSEKLRAMLDEKTITIVPESSIVGMLMSYNDEYKVVKSSSFSIFQHNPYTWVLNGPDFLYTERTTSSLYLDKVTHSWLEGLSKEHRELFVDTFFEIVGTTKATSFHGITQKLIANMPQMTKKLISLDAEDKKMLLYIADKFRKATMEELDQKKKKEPHLDKTL